VLASPVVVLAVHDPGFLRVQGQPQGVGKVAVNGR